MWLLETSLEHCKMLCSTLLANWNCFFRIPGLPYGWKSEWTFGDRGVEVEVTVRKVEIDEVRMEKQTDNDLFPDGWEGLEWVVHDPSIGTQQAALLVTWSHVGSALWKKAGVVRAGTRVCQLPVSCWLLGWWSKWSDQLPLEFALAESLLMAWRSLWLPRSQHLLLQKQNAELAWVYPTSTSDNSRQHPMARDGLF